MDKDFGKYVMYLEIETYHHHSYLYPDLSKFFLLAYIGKYVRCIALNFTKFQSNLWFVKSLLSFAGYMKQKLGF